MLVSNRPFASSTVGGLLFAEGHYGVIATQPEEVTCFDAGA